jgi:hypothetical protein
MLEVLVAVSILLVGLSAVARLNSAVQGLVRQMQNRESALLVCANVIELTTIIDYEKLDPSNVDEPLLVRCGLNDTKLPDVEVSIAVQEIDGGKRVVARVSWAIRSGRRANISLTRWRYPPHEAQS